MEKEKPFVVEGLTISDLSADLEVSAKTLSQVINSKSGGNFSKFLSRYRIIEFKKKIERKENLQYTIEALARDCGFSSKVSFHSAFKREENITPAAYIRSRSSSTLTS